jgi:hypothetical protein
VSKRPRRHIDRRAQKLGLPSGAHVKALNRLNAVSHELFGLGIGMLVQMEERHRKAVASLERELAAATWWQRRKIRQALKSERAEFDVWSGRLRQVVESVDPADAPPELLGLYAARDQV